MHMQINCQNMFSFDIVSQQGKLILFKHWRIKVLNNAEKTMNFKDKTLENIKAKPLKIYIGEAKHIY